MFVHYNPNDFQARNPIVSLGMFDGIHLGHQWLLRHLTDLAKQKNGESVVMSFWPHPRLVLDPQNRQIALLSTLNEKLSLIQRLGIDHFIIIPFTKEVSELGYEEFINSFLVEKIRIKHLLAGFNHHFGKNRKGSFEDIEKNSTNNSFTISRLDEFSHPEGKISSSRIRQLLNCGQIAKANALLDYPYSIEGKVVSGNKIGRSIGFPTANVELINDYRLIPATGVYVILLQYNNTLYKGMLNIGFRPTLKTQNLMSIEAHLFDFNGDLYNQTVRIFFIAQLREERKFGNLDELISQLIKDKELSLNQLTNLPNFIPSFQDYIVTPD